MMKVQLIDDYLVGAAVIDNNPTYAVSRAGDIAIVVSYESRTLHCFACTMISGNVNETCVHMRLVRKAQSQLASTALEVQPVDHIASALQELVTAMRGLLPNNPNLLNADWHLNQLRNQITPNYQVPANVA